MRNIIEIKAMVPQHGRDQIQRCMDKHSEGMKVFLFEVWLKWEYIVISKLVHFESSKLPFQYGQTSFNWL